MKYEALIIFLSGFFFCIAVFTAAWKTAPKKTEQKEDTANEIPDSVGYSGPVLVGRRNHNRSKKKVG